MSLDRYNFHMAIQDFQSARQRAGLEEILARLAGRSNELLSYEEVAHKLKLRASSDRGIKPIPIDAIVGSVGRYADFTRTFLPRGAVDQHRWAGIKAALEDAGLPPIEVYQVGEVYFVIDGNHRVSIARRQGLKTIEAHVVEVRTDIPLTPDMRPEDLILKAEYAEFLEVTRLTDSRPNVDLSVTACCQYEKLLDQIRVHQYFLQQQAQTEVALQTAAENWYDESYIPLAEAIRDRGILRWFPGRTITDLYLWIWENRSSLEKELGWEIQSEIAATDLILERRAYAESGSWRKARTVSRYTDTLFADILVPLSGNETSWDALEQALVIAQRESATLHGLHIVDSREKVQSPDALAVQEQFTQRCAQANVEGRLVIESGDITQKICERAVLTDLIVWRVRYPPSGGLSSLTFSSRGLIVKSPRPILAVPGQASQMRKALLAFDGSPRAREALFVATYLAEMWKTSLVVFSMLEGSKVKPGVQDYVRRYLEIHEVQAEFILAEKGSDPSLLEVGRDRGVDLVLMGGYGGSVIKEVVLGSYLDHVLRNSTFPTFICR